jgi:hypothetical protein
MPKGEEAYGSGDAGNPSPETWTSAAEASKLRKASSWKGAGEEVGESKAVAIAAADLIRSDLIEATEI